MSFSDQVQKWTKGANANIEATYRRAVTLLGEQMATTIPKGGNVPFQDGHLARSLLASTKAMPKMSTAARPPAGGNVGAVALTLKPTMKVWLGYQAAYARRQNYGFVGQDSLGRTYNQAGHYFVEAAIQDWPSIVEQAAKEVTGG